MRHGFIKSTPLEGRAAPPPWWCCLSCCLCFLCSFCLVTCQSYSSYVHFRGVAKWPTQACTIFRGLHHTSHHMFPRPRVLNWATHLPPPLMGKNGHQFQRRHWCLLLWSCMVGTIFDSINFDQHEYSNLTPNPKVFISPRDSHALSKNSVKICSISYIKIWITRIFLSRQSVLSRTEPQRILLWSDRKGQMKQVITACKSWL